jgi:signal transduction histidine kinase
MSIDRFSVDPAPIVLVCPDPDTAASLRTLIDTLDHVQVIVAASSDQVYAALERHQPLAAMVIDADEAGDDGYGLVRSLGMGSATQATPIIIITARHADESEITDAYAMGVYDFMRKPPRPITLLAKLRLLVHQYRQHQRLQALSDEHQALLTTAQSASAAKSTFLANISHEVRTPLNGILGTVDLLRTTTLSPDQRRYADIITSSGQALLAILNDVLDLAKIEAGRTTLHPTRVELDPYMRSVAEPHLARATLNRVQLVMRFERGVPAAITVDTVVLQQVLFNLLSNAVKFTQTGSVTLSVGMSPTSSGLRLMIEDTGPGIPANRLGEIFEAFSQVDPSTTRHHGGTGLGLAITHQLVALLGGTIQVASELGRGTIFTVDIPLVGDGDVVARALDQPIWVISPDDALWTTITHNLSALGFTNVHNLDEPSPYRMSDLMTSGAVVLLRGALLRMVAPSMLEAWVRGFGSRLVIIQGVDDPTNPLVDQGVRTLYGLHDRLDLCAVVAVPANAGVSGGAAVAAPMATEPLQVLLVDDDPINRMIAVEMLEQLGHGVVAAENGLRAVELTQAQKYDVILMDCMMPTMDGYQATRAIRASANPNRNTRIVALTANVSADDQANAKASGMNDFLGKPFKRQALMDVLHGG